MMADQIQSGTRYKREMRELQIELIKLQKWIQDQQL